MFVNYAHRGASHYAPDSTRAAFDLGIKMQANGIETDLHLTKDGHVVLFHNDNLDGKSSGTGPLKEHTLKELKAMDFGSWKDEKYKGEPILTLKEFAEEYFKYDLTFALELKAAGCEEETLAVIKQYDVYDKVFVTSFHYEYLVKMRELDDRVRLSYLVREATDENCQMVKDINGSQLCPQACFTEKEHVDKVNSYGLRARIWGISSLELMEKMCGFDIAGMTVNFPDKLKEFLDK